MFFLPVGARSLPSRAVRSTADRVGPTILASVSNPRLRHGVERPLPTFVRMHTLPCLGPVCWATGAASSHTPAVGPSQADHCCPRHTEPGQADNPLIPPKSQRIPQSTKDSALAHRPPPIERARRIGRRGRPSTSPVRIDRPPHRRSEPTGSASGPARPSLSTVDTPGPRRTVPGSARIKPRRAAEAMPRRRVRYRRWTGRPPYDIRIIPGQRDGAGQPAGTGDGRAPVRT